MGVYVAARGGLGRGCGICMFAKRSAAAINALLCPCTENMAFTKGQFEY